MICAIVTPDRDGEYFLNVRELAGVPADPLWGDETSKGGRGVAWLPDDPISASGTFRALLPGFPPPKDERRSDLLVLEKLLHAIIKVRDGEDRFDGSWCWCAAHYLPTILGFILTPPDPLS